MNTLNYKHLGKKKKRKVEDIFLATVQLHNELVSSPSADTTTRILVQSHKGPELEGSMHAHNTLGLYLFKISTV